jgi:predicted Zn-dependent protease
MNRCFLSLLLFFCFLQVNAEVTAPTELAAGVSSSDIAEVKRIFEQFTKAIGKNASDYTLEIHKSDVLNAYATLGKKIVINSALLEQTKSEAGIAFVIAHELGHVEQKHVLKSIARSSLSSVLRHFLFKQNQLLNGVDYAHSLYYSRDKERDADYFAVDLINKTYCKLPGKLEFFEIVTQGQKSPSPKFLEYLSTHPLPESRLKYLREEIEKSACVI